MSLPFDKWLKLSYPKMLAAALAIGCIFLWRQLNLERGRHDSNTDKSNERQALELRQCENEIRSKDSIIASKNEEIKFIYKTQADEYKQSRKEVEQIRQNSKNIYKKIKRLNREQ